MNVKFNLIRQSLSKMPFLLIYVKNDNNEIAERRLFLDDVILENLMHKYNI